MIKIRSRIFLRHNKTGELLIERNIIGRVMNMFALFILLLVVIYGLQTGVPPSTSGSLILLFLFLVFLYKGGVNKVYLFSQQDLIITNRFIGLTFKLRQIPIERIRSVAINSVEYNIHRSARKAGRGTSSESPNPGLYYLKLLIDPAELGDTVAEIIEDSTNFSELQACGLALSKYLNIPFEE